MVPEGLSIAEAKATFSEQVRTAEAGDAVVITRRGRPVAAIVPIEDVERLRRLRDAGPEGGLASLAGGWKGSAELAKRVSGRRSRKRRTTSLD